MRRIERDAVYGTNLLALRLIIMSDTLGAFARFNLVDFFAWRDCLVWAFRLTHVTINAVISDD
jgi:hypothetical protein